MTLSTPSRPSLSVEIRVQIQSFLGIFLPSRCPPMTFLKVLFSLGISLGCTKKFGSITFLGLDHYCRTAFTHLIQQILFKTKDALSQAAITPSRVKLEFHEAREEFTDQGKTRHDHRLPRIC